MKKKYNIKIWLLKNKTFFFKGLYHVIFLTLLIKIYKIITNSK